MEVIGNTWFTNSRGTIGIVVYNDGFKNKAKISVVPGNNYDSDIQTIIKWGSSFPLLAAYLLLEKKLARIFGFRKAGIDIE